MESLKMIQRAFELNEDDVRANNNYVFANRTKSVKDLKIGALFDGQVTSVTSFGAFVNIGMVIEMIKRVSEAEMVSGQFNFRWLKI